MHAKIVLPLALLPPPTGIHTQRNSLVLLKIAQTKSKTKTQKQSAFSKKKKEAHFHNVLLIS